MKFALAVLCTAPLALASSAHLAAKRDGHLVGGKEQHKPEHVQKAQHVQPQHVQAQIENIGHEAIIIWHNNGGGAETVTVTQTVTQTVGGEHVVTEVPAKVAVEAAATHTVTVGGSAGLVFTPQEMVANVGDELVFEFESMNHTATQSTFDLPCDPLEGGMDTGFMANPDNSVDPAPRVAMQVMTDKPIWFYCRQGNHCGSGMVFSVNPGPAGADNSHAAFQAKAIEQKGEGGASPITGGDAAPPAPDAAAPPPPAEGEGEGQPPAPASMAEGSGNVQNGECSCSCLCGMDSFPNAAAQGIGAIGGMGGAMPMSSAAVARA